MARDPYLLDSNQPSAIAPATPNIAHVQLRDLLICPRERGVLNYVVYRGIAEQDLNKPKAPVRVVSNLNFTPNSLTSLQIGNDTLIAAGGQDTEIHLSYHTPTSTPSSQRTRVAWELEDRLTGSINNSVLLTALSLTRSNESSVDPRVGISNNDGSVKLYDIPLRASRKKLHQVGQVKLEVPVNHSSISPDGRTLLSVGDSNKVYIHQITGGASISFAPVTTLTIPPPDSSPLPYASSSLAAAFSTAYSGDGTKFAVASQEGVVAVWDVRSTKPVKVFQTDKTRGMGPGTGNGNASGWLYDDPFEWTRGTKAPGWCVRSVKFNGGEGARLGKEVMAFTEHTSIVHLVDARTFETHDTIRVPALKKREPPRRGPSSNTSTATRRPTSSSSRRTSTAAGTAGTASSSGTGTDLLSISGRLLSRAEAFESALADQQANPSSSSRNLIRRLLPVSNARRSGLSSSSPTRSISGANTRPTRTFVPPQSAAVHLANRAAARAHSRSHSAIDPLEPANSLSASTPAGIAARLPPASAARLTTAAAAVRGGGLAGRRSASASGTSSSSTMHTSTTSNSSTSTSGSRPASTSGTPAIVQALGDAFRIPVPASAYSAPSSIGDSTWRTLGREWRDVASSSRLSTASVTSGADPSSSNSRGTTEGSAGEVGPERYHSNNVGSFDASMVEDVDEDADEGIVVVPDLGDRDVESEVHALLAVHGIQSRFGARDPRSRPNVTNEPDNMGADVTAQDARTLIDAYTQYYDGQSVEDDEGDIELDDIGVNAEEMGDDHQALFMRALASLHDVNPDRVFTDADAGDEDEREDEPYDIRYEDLMPVDDEGGEEQDEDEDEGREDEDEDAKLDFECTSRGSNSRSGSPFASSSSSAVRGSGGGLASPRAYSPSLSRPYGWHGVGSPPWTLSGALGGPPFTKNSTTRGASDISRKYTYYEELDIAGLCFDPCGEHMYVAGVGMGAAGTPSSSATGYGGHGRFDLSGADHSREGVGAVVEWVVRGAEKRWWVDGGWM